MVRALLKSPMKVQRELENIFVLSAGDALVQRTTADIKDPADDLSWMLVPLQNTHPGTETLVGSIFALLLRDTTFGRNGFVSFQMLGSNLVLFSSVNLTSAVCI